MKDGEHVRTSGGALCAALGWYALRRHEEPKFKRLIDFWHDNIAHGWQEEIINDLIVDSMRMVNRGLFPTLQLCPSSPLVKTMMSFMTIGTRRSFTDFPELLRKYIDFDEIASSAAFAA
jgi:NTE family protein